MTAAPSTAPSVLRNVRRLEWYIRVSVYVVVGCAIVALPIEAAALVARWPLLPWLPIITVLIITNVVINIVVLHRTIDQMHRGDDLVAVLRSRTGVLIAVALATGVAAALIAARPGGGAGVATTFAVLMATVGSVTPLLSSRRLTLALAVAIVVNAVVGYAAFYPEWPTALGYAVFTTLALVFYISTVWLSVWMLRVLWELDTLRQTAPQLAVAEERLRFSRDLHDTFGRTLSVVAVKSELAAELARRGRSEQAAEEMAEVRRVAEDAGREVRAVVSGYRRPDLAQELVGARSVLESAGIRCDVRSTGRPPATAAATTLGWVVREAVTNVLRHSAARCCTIELASDDRGTRLLVGNDGVHGRPAGDGRGTGLIGLSERVHRAGGTLTHELERDRFVLTVTLPVDLVVEPSLVTDLVTEPTLREVQT